MADSETVLVGVSQRTNEKGADKLAKFLFAAVAKHVGEGLKVKTMDLKKPKEFGFSPLIRIYNLDDFGVP